MRTHLFTLLAVLVIAATAGAQTPVDRKGAQLRAARAAVAQGQLNDAIAAFNEYLNENPDDDAVMNESGAVMLKAGRADEAVVTLAESLRRNPKQPGTIRLLADACIARKDAAAAIEIVQLGVMQYPKDAAMRLKLADVYAAAGRKDEAIWQYRQVLTQDPANAAATQALLSLGAITTTTLAPSTTLAPTTTVAPTTTLPPTTTTTKAVTTTTAKPVTTTVKPTTTSLKPTTTTVKATTTTLPPTTTTVQATTTTAKATTTTLPVPIAPVTPAAPATTTTSMPATLPGGAAVRAVPPPTVKPVVQPSPADAAAKLKYEDATRAKEGAEYRKRRAAVAAEQARQAQYEKALTDKESSQRATRDAAAVSPEQRARKEAEQKTVAAEIAAHNARTAKPATTTTTVK